MTSSLKHATILIPDMLASRKLTLTSKKPREQYLKVMPRKPVKECYCSEVTETTRARSSRTRHKSVSPCRPCRGEVVLGPVREPSDKVALTLPISCETLRRVQEIDYAPRSRFLRKVQSKICELRTADQTGDCLRSCPRSSSYHRFMTSARMQSTFADKKTASPGEGKRVDDRQESPTSPIATANSLASEQSGPDDVACASSKGTRVPTRKLSKSTLRKTISSKRQIPESSERSASKSPMRGKRTARLHKWDCPCCRRNERGTRTAKFSGDKCAEGHDLLEYHERHSRQESHAFEDFMNQNVENLKRFREQNYFETHGSSHILTSSRSSGSWQQYVLNERLFPEPVGKMDKQDLIVTIPPSATMQRKRVHYFPRYVVRQEKNTCNTNYRRKRCQSCPLTGHAVDLGILKIRPPLNSLALKHQKKALTTSKR